MCLIKEALKQGDSLSVYTRDETQRAADEMNYAGLNDGLGK
jgi:hypothetical protein